MIINVNHEGNDLIVLPEGRIDSATADELDAVLQKEIAPETTSLTVNMKKVEFISSKGLRVLVSAYRRLNGRPVLITEANSSIMEVFRLSGMLKIFQVTGE